MRKREAEGAGTTWGTHTTSSVLIQDSLGEASLFRHFLCVYLLVAVCFVRTLPEHLYLYPRYILFFISFRKLCASRSHLNLISFVIMRGEREESLAMYFSRVYVCIIKCDRAGPFPSQ